MNNKEGMTLIVKTVARISVWLIILYGIYIVLHGHLTPGGGFAGGVIISLAFLNFMLAYGRNNTSKWLNISLLSDIEASSASLILALGIMGMAFGGGFLANFITKGKLFHLLSAGTIPIYNILIGAKVGMALFVVVWTLAITRIGEEVEG
ncbi:MAG: hypothetical protein H0Z29_09045 [Candidatus Marinimicrobia bacterium]|nr:hypothetical protein [Candidatus Neomarinimicrobiota bacterium]